IDGEKPKSLLQSNEEIAIIIQLTQWEPAGNAPPTPYLKSGRITAPGGSMLREGTEFGRLLHHMPRR
ncbi:MAG: hypothetical protein ACI3VI_02955, partial [Vescimonas sp.]